MLEAIDSHRLVNAQSLTHLFRWDATRPGGESGLHPMAKDVRAKRL